MKIGFELELKHLQEEGKAGSKLSTLLLNCYIDLIKIIMNDNIETLDELREKIRKDESYLKKLELTIVEIQIITTLLN